MLGMTDSELLSFYALNRVGFACSKSVCVGWRDGKKSPTDEALFKAIQAGINVGLRILKRSTIAVDGLIGAGTVAAYSTVRAAWPGIGGPSVSSKEALATNALGVFTAIRAGVSGIYNTKPLALPGGGGGGGTAPTPEAAAMDAAMQALAPKLPPGEAAVAFVKKNKFPIVGAIGFVALGALLLKGGGDGGGDASDDDAGF